MKKVIVYALAVLAFASCKDDPDGPHPSLQFTAVTLYNGTPTNAFPAGSDPVFAFEVTNHSGSDIRWEGYCLAFTHEDLFETSRITGDDAGSRSEFKVGNPVRASAPCSGEPVFFTPGTDYYMQVAWSANPDNEPLVPGQYEVKFEVPIAVTGNYRETQSFKTTFDILP